MNESNSTLFSPVYYSRLLVIPDGHDVAQRSSDNPPPRLVRLLLITLLLVLWLVPILAIVYHIPALHTTRVHSHNE